jgi:hypothetical protein
MRLPDNVYKAHLAPKGSPTAFIKILGGSASALAIQKLMARICPLSSQWKWEAIPHGDDAYLVSFPTTNDLKRVDGCNIPGCEARNRENTEVCIAFMHRKSGKFLRF